MDIKIKFSSKKKDKANHMINELNINNKLVKVTQYIGLAKYIYIQAVY